MITRSSPRCSGTQLSTEEINHILGDRVHHPPFRERGFSDELPPLPHCYVVSGLFHLLQGEETGGFLSLCMGPTSGIISCCGLRICKPSSPYITILTWPLRVVKTRMSLFRMFFMPWLTPLVLPSSKHSSTSTQLNFHSFAVSVT